MKFKNMEAVFVVNKDTAFESGAYGTNRKDWVFTVTRYKSGCFAYGDRSAHSVEFVKADKSYSDGKYYDTRYDGITTDDDKWIEFWKSFVEKEYTFELKLVSFKTSFEDSSKE